MDHFYIQKPQEREQWHQKVVKLEGQLLEAKIQQINLKRINKNLQETLRNAANSQMQNEQFRSGHNFDKSTTWREKYEIELEKNIKNQQYIKVLQKKRNTLSLDKRNLKNKNSSSKKNNLKTQDQNGISIFGSGKCHQNNYFTALKHQNSVSKMRNFMDRLLKDKYQISQFPMNINSNEVRQYQQPLKSQYFSNDPIERMFCSVRQISNKQNRNAKQWDRTHRLDLKQNINSINSNIQMSFNRKLQLNPYFR